MTTYEITGTVVAIGETKTFESGFTKRDIVVDVSTNPQYPSPVQFTFKKDRVALLTPVKVGDSVTLKFSVDGRAWNGPNGVKYFNDITGWSCVVSVAAGPASAPAANSAVKTAKGADVIKVWAIKHGCTLEEATTDWNTATSELTKVWKTIFPGKRRNQLTPEDLAAVVNAITGAQAEAGSAPAAEDPTDFPF